MRAKINRKFLQYIYVFKFSILLSYEIVQTIYIFWLNESYKKFKAFFQKIEKKINRVDFFQK